MHRSDAGGRGVASARIFASHILSFATRSFNSFSLRRNQRFASIKASSISFVFPIFPFPSNVCFSFLEKLRNKKRTHSKLNSNIQKSHTAVVTPSQSRRSPVVTPSLPRRYPNSANIDARPAWKSSKRRITSLHTLQINVRHLPNILTPSLPRRILHPFRHHLQNALIG